MQFQLSSSDRLQPRSGFGYTTSSSAAASGKEGVEITYGSEENITEREMEAAQHLMQLSDEEDISLNIITKKKIVALFGKDDIYQDQCTNTKEMVVMRVMPSQRKKKKKLDTAYLEQHA
ncbi:hypothetical protein EUTSA_v100238500mg, partial [Eutrema salsugineum]